MNTGLERKAGTAILWKALELGATRAISLLRLLILARLLAPDDFGLLAIGLATVHTLLALTNLGLIPALVQRQDADKRLYDVAWTLRVTRALLITLSLVAAAPLVARLYAEPLSEPIIRVLAAWPLLEALGSIKVAELTRLLRFRSLVLVSLSGVTLETVTAISLAREWGAWALVVGVLAGAVARLVASYLVAPHRPRLVFDPSGAGSLLHFGRWIFLSSVTAAANGLLMQVIISRQLGAASLGAFYMAMKLAFLPSEVATQVVGTVAFPLHARLQSNLRQSALVFRATFSFLAAMLLPIYGLLLVLAPTIEGHVLGQRWAGMGSLIRILAIAGIVGLLGDAAVPALKGHGKPWLATLLDVLQSLIVLPAVWWLARSAGLSGVGVSILLATAISQLLAALFVRRLLPIPWKGLSRAVLAIALVTLVGVALSLTGILLLPGLGGAISGTCLALLAMAALLSRWDRRHRLGLGSDLARFFPEAARRLGHGAQRDKLGGVTP